MKKNPNSSPRFETELLVKGYNQLRLGHYAWQGALLPLISWLSGQGKKNADKDFLAHMQLALPKIKKLFDQDAQNIANGLYPATVLKPENPITHFSRIPLLFLDAYRAQKQRNEKQTKAFDESSAAELEKFPDYYLRNFHFQDNGYLGEKSARLYEHQVEVLFSGSADAMRRQVIQPLKNKFETDGKGLHFLEIGSGTGRLTRFMALAFPKAKITCVDLSPQYLGIAGEKLREFKNISYVQGSAEELDFKDQTFDAIYSCYLFHELPEAVRRKVITEGHRLLKKNGLYVIADSLQKNDDPDLNWALDQFPKDFHEPFYKNYTEKSLSQLLEKCGFQVKASQAGFLTKVVTAQPSVRTSKAPGSQDH